MNLDPLIIERYGILRSYNPIHLFVAYCKACAISQNAYASLKHFNEMDNKDIIFIILKLEFTHFQAELDLKEVRIELENKFI